jgi:excisionase family DNA binding protein
VAEWLTVEEVAERLRVSPRTVRGWLQDGRLKGRNLGGRAGWRIREKDVDAFMESLEGGEHWEGKTAA